MKQFYYKLLTRLRAWIESKLKAKAESDHQKAKKMAMVLKKMGIKAEAGGRTFPPSDPGSVLIDEESLKEYLEKKRIENSSLTSV